jgi:hypothetical protein
MLTEELRRLPVSGRVKRMRDASAENRTRETLHVTNGIYAERACGRQRGTLGSPFAEPKGSRKPGQAYARLDDEWNTLVEENVNQPIPGNGQLMRSGCGTSDTRLP